MVLRYKLKLAKVKDLTPIEDNIAVSISIDSDDIQTLEFDYDKKRFIRNSTKEFEDGQKTLKYNYKKKSKSEVIFQDEHDYFIYLLAQKALDEFKVKDVPLFKLYGKVLPPFTKTVGYVEAEKLIGSSIVLNNHEKVLESYIDTDCGTNENKSIFDPDLLHKKKLLTDQSVIIHDNRIMHYEGYLPGSNTWMKIKKTYALKRKLPYSSKHERRSIEEQIMNVASFPSTVGTRTRSGITISHLNKEENFAFIMRSQSTGIITQIGPKGFGKRKLMFVKVAESCSEALKDYIVLKDEEFSETKKNVVLLEVRYGVKKKLKDNKKLDYLYVKEAYLVSPNIITERLA